MYIMVTIIDNAALYICSLLGEQNLNDITKNKQQVNV